jgi:hypothetical protein
MFDRPAAIAGRLKALALFAGAMLAIWFAGQALLYRSGAYFSAAEPESNTGAVVNSLLLLEKLYRPGVRTALVFGDSRVAEGFSNDIARGDGPIDFINVSVPGSTPRTWYYLLREIDRRGYEYDAVVIGTLYRPTERTRRADWPLDPTHQAPLLGLRDLADYPATYDAPEMRERALHAVLFPALTMQKDTQAALAAPLQRYNKLQKFRPAYLGAVAAYPGREETMPALGFAADGSVVDFGSATEAQRALVQTHLADLGATIEAGVLQANDAYLTQWFGAIAERAGRKGAKLVLFPLPRGPYRNVLPAIDGDSSAERAIASIPNAIALPPTLLQELEDPVYFFDVLHANRAGRERMSAIIGERVRSVLDDGAP